MKNKAMLGNLCLILTALIWGCAFVAQSVGMEYVEPITFNGIRCIIGGFVLIIANFAFDSVKKKNGTIKNKNEYINIINSKLNKWTFNRLCLSDQAILLLFTSELLNNRAPMRVCIDVAVDLAHRYCDDKSYKYIHKVLDRIGKENA